MLTAPLSTLHTVTFDRERQNTVGRCTCGWLKRGAKAEVYNAAAVHDLGQWPVTDDEMHASKESRP
jgi:hypothetical protein